MKVAFLLLLSGCWAFVDHQNDETAERMYKQMRGCLNACERDLKRTKLRCQSINVQVIDSGMCACDYQDGTVTKVKSAP